ncbi:MAG: NifU family protein [Bacilli bacterium]
MDKTEEKIIEVLDKIKPFLESDGGNLEFVKYEEGNVYIKLSGACSHCSMIDYTIKDGIEATLVEEIPEVVSVIRID